MNLRPPPEAHLHRLNMSCVYTRVLIDVHAHLYALSPKEIEEIVKAVVVVSNGEDWKTSEECIRLAHAYPTVFAAVGYHPTYAKEYRDISPLLGEKVVAIGEIGLDGKIDVPIDVQEKVFCIQLELAERTGLPVIIHSRRAHEKVLEIIASYNVKFDLHWFSGGLSAAIRALELGAYFSIGPYAVNSKYYRALLAELPMERILTETDTPVLIGGKKNTPVRVREVVRVIAEVKGTQEEDVVAQVFKNFVAFFGVEPWRSS